ncbi:MAG: type IV pilus assembly protein PilM [Parcubacteria group bacterium]|nr:type IV pilus assembly protein PilM [Parcubacteria group bacterium]
MSLFGSKSVLGVDLGTAGIKIAELSRIGGDRFELKNYGFLDFLAKESAGAPLSGAGVKIGDDFLITGLRDLLNRIKPSTKDAVASISSFLTFATVIEMPYLSAKDLEKAIPFEARKYVPIPLSEVVLDWSIINVREISQYESSLAPKTQFPNVEVFLAAVPKNEAERYKNIFLSAGLNIRALELENIALTRALIGDDHSPSLVINLGGRSTSIIIIDKGFERVSRNYELGGFGVTKTLAASLGISFERAEELKKKEGLKGNSSFAEAAAPLIDMIVFEAKKTVANYEESKKTKIAKVILTGGQSQMFGLKEYFSQKLGREVLIGDPLRGVSFSKVLEGTLKEAGPSLAVALGLAMRKI